MSNPLLTAAELPPFSSIRAEHAEPAITQLIEQAQATIDTLLADMSNFTWEGLLAPIENLEDQLAQAWSPISHLNNVCNDEAIRAAYNACLERLSQHSTWLGQHEALYRAYQHIADTTGDQLDAAQRQALNNALRDFRLAGVSLPPAERSRYGELKQQLAKLGSQFGEHVLDATNHWRKQVSAEDLAGLPESALAVARQAAEQAGVEGYLITLEFPSYLPVMTYCDSAQLREEVYTAYCTRASDQGPDAGRWNNAATIVATLDLRRELAQLLGFDNYAEYSLATKMAETSSQVTDFLEQLAARSLPQAREEWQELTAFAREQHGVETLRAWDVSYYAEKLRQARYALSQEDVRPYLPVPRALAGLFEVAHRLYAVDIAQVQNFDTYHPDAQLYEVSREGEVIARFYLDLYARADKRGGAWMDDCRVRRSHAGRLQLPVAYLVCNFTPPVGEAPALLTHDELTTLFHEFGHGLHHMLTQQTVAAVSGINGVAWDAVELPSQFLENWCWQPEALAFISGHHETGEPLPQELLDKLLAARNFQSAMTMLRQLEFALFDFRLHTTWSGGDSQRVQALLNTVREEVSVVPAPSFNRFQNSFSHIFAGGYAAGYYSYKWAEVLSSDAFARFEDEGIFNSETGADFQRCILEAGGADEAMTQFIAFRGRPPELSALLRHSGIGEATPG